MNLVEMKIADNRCEVKMTVLRREGGAWQPWEVANLTNGLITEASGHPEHPEYLVLYGHYTKEQALKAHGGGFSFTATQVVGIKSEELPFNPGFI